MLLVIHYSGEVLKCKNEDLDLPYRWQLRAC